MKALPFIPTTQIAQKIEEIVANIQGQRKPFERRWYNNNFFDDGYHYRFVSRTTGRVVDLSTTSDTFIPYRAIPKSSRQIRGIANLLVSNEYKPVIYPEKISSANYQQNPEMYQQAMTQNKLVAKRVSQWVEKKWDDLNIKDLLTQMVIMTAKHGVSFLQIWPDAVKEDIKVQLYDAFEIYLRGELFSIYDSPYIVKAIPQTIAEIQANEEFDEVQIERLNPDNKYASSEIKEAYMMARFGTKRPDDKGATVILKEGFVKEYIGDENKDKIKSDLGDDFKDKKKGDPIIRQVFECAGVWLSDKYINLPEYPFIDFRMEPGPIYQVPLIERFIPANKSLDSVMSRVERHIGTMAVGMWLKRRGEQYTINNLSGGQVVEYEQTPPVQAQVASLPSELFAFINQLNSIIEEQGASTSALGQVPTGVKSGVAIESLKATEYANLKVASNQIKRSVKEITCRMIDLAANYFMSPQTVYGMDNGNPDYFDIIGQKGMEQYQKLANKKGALVNIPDAIPIKHDYKVEIEIESGLGYTEEGKRNTMISILEWMMKLAQMGYVTNEAVGLVIQRFLEIFQFGSTAEFMDALEAGTPPLTENQIKEVKIAVMEVIKDLQNAQQPQAPMPSTGMEAPAQTAEDQDILKIKTGVMQAFSDLKNANQGGNNAIDQGGEQSAV
jgi:hypothetical protein